MENIKAIIITNKANKKLNPTIKLYVPWTKIGINIEKYKYF